MNKKPNQRSEFCWKYCRIKSEKSPQNETQKKKKKNRGNLKFKKDFKLEFEKNLNDNSKKKLSSLPLSSSMLSNKYKVSQKKKRNKEKYVMKETDSQEWERPADIRPDR